MVKRITLFIILLFLITHSIQAQPPGGGGCDPDEEDCNEEEVPLDDGVTILLIGGVIYGVVKLNRNFNQQSVSENI